MTRKLPLATYPIILYLVFAFGWWGTLLLAKENQSFEARAELIALRTAVSRGTDAGNDYTQTDEYRALVKTHERQRYMIFGEAAFIFISMGIGLFLLYRTVTKEIGAAEQQRNFLLSITHELKSPLAGIRLILETFQKRTGLAPELQKKLSTNALTETDRLTALVNDLLLSAKLESAYQLNEEPIDLGELVQDASERVGIKYKTAKINVDIEPDLPPVTGDRLGLMSVAVNLLENAAKYSQPEPVIHTSVQRGGGSELVWEVKDNGMGIPAKLKKRVFTKFYRVGNEDTRSTKGTGLGLFIVKELVSMHGGQLELTDNPDGGTIMRIFLPTAA